MVRSGLVLDVTRNRGARRLRVARALPGVALILLLALVSACGTQHLYPGEPRQEHDLSILSPQDYFFTGTGVKTIDGKSVDKWKNRFALLPGRHTVEGLMVGTGAGVAPSFGYGPFCLKFESVANGRYALHGNYAGDFLSWLRDDLWSMWIEDEKSGEIVAATEKFATEELFNGLGACDAVDRRKEKEKK